MYAAGASKQYIQLWYHASNLVYKFQWILITFCYDLIYFICVQSQQQLKQYSQNKHSTANKYFVTLFFTTKLYLNQTK